MKLMNLGLGAMLAATALAMSAPTVLADCTNYGNQVSIGSNYNCVHEEYYCDNENGANSGTLAGGGAGAAGESDVEAGTEAGASGGCEQGSGYNEAGKQAAFAMLRQVASPGSDEQGTDSAAAEPADEQA